MDRQEIIHTLNDIRDTTDWGSSWKQCIESLDQAAEYVALWDKALNAIEEADERAMREHNSDFWDGFYTVKNIITAALKEMEG